jgi:hypothetical protein
MHNNSSSSEPKKWEVGESFAIQRPKDWRLLRLTLLFLIGYFTFGEIFFRLDSVRGVLTGPRIGSRHDQFEIQAARLEKLISEGEPIDCIFLGNSMIWLGVDPLVVNESFQEITGHEIHCFNFGVSALPASSAGQIAPMLVDRYHPKVLIYGTFARDYAIPADAEDAYVVTDTPWLKQQNGEYSLLGWLYSHSAVFQYMGHMHDILFVRYLENVFVQENLPPYLPYGLDPKYDIRTDVNSPPDFESKDNRDPVMWLGHFEIKQEDLYGLQKIVQQKNKGTQVIVIEMPFHENAYEFFPNGKQNYDTYVQNVDSITASSLTPFWRRDEQPVLTPELWWDYFHLNLTGADLFSEWLGAKLADSYLQGNLTLSSTVIP